MQAKTIEGLVGARINTDLINTPAEPMRKQSVRAIQQQWRGQWAT